MLTVANLAHLNQGKKVSYCDRSLYVERLSSIFCFRYTIVFEPHVSDPGKQCPLHTFFLSFY